MVSFSVHVEGLDAVLEQLDRLPEDTEPGITRGLTVAASEAVEQIQSSISDSFPPPSIPFTPPHLRTGELRRSVRIESVEPLNVILAVGGPGSMVPYAAMLEFGTSKMEPRPFVLSVIERVMPEIPNIILEEVNRELDSNLS